MGNVGKLAAIAATAVVAGGSAILLRGKVASVATRVGAGCSPNNPIPHAGSGAEMGRIARVAERLRRVWPDVTGESGSMPEAALEIALSQAFLESGVAEAGGGGWWKDKSGDGTGGNMVGSGNLGARQCGANDSGGDYYTCVEYGDSAPNPDGTQTYFPAKFRYYQAGTIGGKQRDAGDVAAYEFLRDITKQFPALEELKSGDVLAYAIRQGPKYRAADPKDQKVFGRVYNGGNGYYGGFGATMQDRVGSYGRAIVSHLPAVAAALGHKRIYACIAPELLSGGATHAAVSGGCCGGPDPEEILLVHSLDDDPYADDSAADMAAKNIEGLGITVATTVAAAAIAAGAGAIVSHQLDKGKPKIVLHLPKEMVAAAQKKKVSAKGGREAKPAHAPPALDEDRGSIAALTASAALLPGTHRDSSGNVYYNPPLHVATSTPELSDDRGSIAALQKIPGVSVSMPAKQSSELTREDIKQMFPTYTESQIDDALKGLQGAPIEGVVNGTIRRTISPAVAAIAAFASGTVVGAGGLLLAQAATSRRDNAPTIVPEPPPPIAPPPAPRPRTYVVRADDTPFKIAIAYNASRRAHWWTEIANANPHKETTGIPRGWKQLLPGETIVIPKEWPGSSSVEGARIEGIGTVAAILAALVAGGAYAIHANSERIIDSLVQALRRHGLDVVLPHTEVARGYARVPPSTPAAQAALAEFSTDTGVNAKSILQKMFDSGFSLQAPSGVLVKGEEAANVLASPPVAAMSAAISRAAAIQGTDSTVTFRLDGDTAMSKPNCPCQPPCAIDVPHVHAFCPESTRVEGEQSSVNPHCGRPHCPLNEPHAHATYGGERDVTPEAAAATDAHMAERYGVEGAGTVAAVVGGGLAAGALAALALSKMGKDAPVAPPVAVAAPAPAPAPVAAPRPIQPTPKEVARKNLQRLQDELTVMLTPDASGAIKADPGAIAAKSQAVNEAKASLDALSVAGVVESFDSETGHGTILPFDGTSEVHFNAATVDIGEFVQFEPVQNDCLSALRLAGTLPMARAIPGSNGERVVWYVEKPHLGETSVSSSAAAAVPVRFARIVRQLRVADTENVNSFCGRNCHLNEPHSHAAPVSGASVDIGARDDEPDDADKALATASDASDALSSLVNAVAKGKRAIERQATVEDPKCRKAVRVFVEKHPLVARWFAPQLRDMAGVDIGCACNSVGATAIESFANRYTDELLRQRASRGYEGAECEPSAEEDRAVLGALMAPLGLSHDEEDAIYTAASRTASTALDLYAPGSGGRATEASDAISQLITGRKMAPHAASPAPAAHAPRPDPTRRLKAQLAAEKAKVAVAKEFAHDHPHIVKWFKPDLRSIT